MKQFLRFLSVLAIIAALSFGFDCLAAEQEGGIPEAPALEEGYVPGVPKIALTPEQLAIKVAYRKARWARRQALAALDKKLSELETDLSDVKLQLSQKPSEKNEQILLESLEEIQQLMKDNIFEQLEILLAAKESLSNFVGILEQSPLFKMKIKSDLLNEYEYMIQDWDALDKRFNDLESQLSLLLSPEEKEKMEQEATEEETLKAEEGQPEQKEKEEKEQAAQEAAPAPEELQAKIEYRKGWLQRRVELRQLAEKRRELIKDRTEFKDKLNLPGSKLAADIKEWNEAIHEIDALLIENFNESFELLNQQMRAEDKRRQVVAGNAKENAALDADSALSQTMETDLALEALDNVSPTIKWGTLGVTMHEAILSGVPPMTKFKQPGDDELFGVVAARIKQALEKSQQSKKEKEEKVKVQQTQTQQEQKAYESYLESYREVQAVREKKLAQLDERLHQLEQDYAGFGLKLLNSEELSSEDTQNIQSWKESLEQARKLLAKNIAHQLEILQTIRADAEDILDYLTALTKSTTKTPQAIKDQYVDVLDDSIEAGERIKFLENELKSFAPEQKQEQEGKEEKSKGVESAGQAIEEEQPEEAIEPEQEEEIKEQAQQEEQQPEKSIWEED